VSAEHTPIPWAIHEGFVIGKFHSDGEVHDIADPRCAPADTCRDEIDANAEFICRAVNAHAALVAALKIFLLARSGNNPSFSMDEAEDKAMTALELAGELAGGAE
jgi:hypothetical protein